MLTTKHKPTYKNLVYQIQLELLNTYTDVIKFQWVKSHCGIRYNEVADLMARLAHNKDTTTLVNLEKEELLTTLNSCFHKYWTQHWKAQVIATQTGSFLRKFIDKPSFKPWLSIKPRIVETTLCRFRIGHVGINTHMFRFEMKDTNTCSRCGVQETAMHFWLHCRKNSNARTDMYDKLSACLLYTSDAADE